MILLVPFSSPLSYSGLKMEEARSFDMFLSDCQLRDVLFQKTKSIDTVVRTSDVKLPDLIIIILCVSVVSFIGRL
jgi:hypothetical protein